MIGEILKTSDVIIFDCDGVLMDSNRIKEDAFVTIAVKHLGKSAGDFIREFHKKNGGLSRVLKFQTAIERFCPEKLGILDKLCQEFEALSRHKILNCKLAHNCEEVLSSLKIKNKRLIVLSGTPTTSLMDILSTRKLSQYFDEILGSPTSKVDHLKDLHEKGVLKHDCNFVFIGDSTTDLHASREFENCQFFWSEEFDAFNAAEANISVIPGFYHLAIVSESI